MRILIVLLLTLLTANAFASGTATIILENIIDPDITGGGQDRSVNIFIKDGIVRLMTTDPVNEDSEIIVFDASDTILIGRLVINQPAQFLLLDEDPRDNVQVILDTRTHATFAIINGEIVRNNLLRVSTRPKRPTGWLAYTPPPFLLPQGSELLNKWNLFKTDKISALLTGALALDVTRLGSQNSANVAQVGDIRESEGGNVRGLRVGVIGTLNFPRPWIYTVYAAFNSFDRGFDSSENDSFTWFDYRLDIPVFSSQTLSVGKQKEPINMERTMSMFALPLQERSISADTFFPSRNFGAVLSGNLLDTRMSWAGGVFNDWLVSDGSRSDNTTAYVGRLTYIPLITTDGSNLVHTGIGYRYSDGKEGFQRKQTPEINVAPPFIDTGAPFSADRSETWNYELSYRRGPFWLDSEYSRIKIYDSPYGELNFSGYHVGLSWLITGEMRGYNRRSGTFKTVPVSRPVDRGGWGAWEFAMRYSAIDMSDKGLLAGEADVYTMGLNWWLSTDTGLSVNLRHVELDKPAPDGIPILHGQVSGVVGRIFLILD